MCGDAMEGEAAPVARMFVGLNDGSTLFQRETLANLSGQHSAPGGHYYCAGCDSEWVWIGRRSKLRMIDGAEYDRARHAK